MEYNELTGMGATELSQLRRELAKRANQRMLRLERSNSPITGEAYHAGAYDIAQEYLRQTGRGTRFSESINYAKEDTYRLKREIMELDTFLHSKTSTVSGNKKVEQKRIETFTSSEYGLSAEVVASKGFYDFLQSEAYDYFVKNSFTSEQLIDIYNAYREEGASHDAVKQAIAKYKANLKETNANATNGRAKKASVKEMLSYINDATGVKLTPEDVLKIEGS